MSSRRRRGRTAGTGQSAAAGAGVAAAPRVAPAPKMEWRTFPVLFAFSFGGFVGLELGIISAAYEDSVFSLLSFLVFGIPLGFAVSRLTTRWMINHNWVKPRPARKKA